MLKDVSFISEKGFDIVNRIVGSKDFDQRAIEAGAPPSFFCPICFRVLRDPVTISSGQTYDRQCIEGWLAQGNNVCPVTDQELQEPVTVVSNLRQRKAIEEWCKECMPHALDERGTLAPRQNQATYEIHASSCLPPIDEDFALAIRLQEDELEHYSARHPEGLPDDESMVSQKRRRSVCSMVNLLLLAATLGMVAVFVLALWQGGWQIQSLSQNPMVGPSSDALIKLGSKDSSKIRDQNQWWRLVSSLFLSSGIIQLFGAVTSLWILGKYLECSNQLLLPGLTIPVLFLLSGIAGCLVSVNVAFDHNSTGSSAAVCGLLGGVWMEQMVNWRLYKNHVITLAILILLTGMFVVISLLPLVGFWFHVSALACGALLIPCMLRPRVDIHSSQAWLCMKWAVKYSLALLVLAVIALGVISLKLNKAAIAQTCSACDTIDCVTIRDWWTCDPSSTIVQPQASCQFTQNLNATTTITCPSGFGHLVASNSITNQILACNTACSASQAPAVPVGGPDSAGVLI